MHFYALLGDNACPHIQPNKLAGVLAGNLETPNLIRCFETHTQDPNSIITHPFVSRFVFQLILIWALVVWLPLGLLWKFATSVHHYIESKWFVYSFIECSWTCWSRCHRLFVVCAYVLMDCGVPEAKDELYVGLSRLIETVRSPNIVVLVCDFNDQLGYFIGKDKAHRRPFFLLQPIALTIGVVSYKVHPTTCCFWWAS